MESLLCAGGSRLVSHGAQEKQQQQATPSDTSSAGWFLGRGNSCHSFSPRLSPTSASLLNLLLLTLGVREGEGVLFLHTKIYQVHSMPMRISCGWPLTSHRCLATTVTVSETCEDARPLQRAVEHVWPWWRIVEP